jgi:ABC-2 type transport system permease protein
VIPEILGKYRAIFSIGLQNTFVYRWNFLLRSLFALIPLFGTVFVWRAIFDGTSGSIAGYDFSEMVFYFLIVLLVDNLITPTEDEWQIAAEIREGQLSSFLLKPFDFLAYRSCIFVGSRLLYTAITLLPVIGVFWWYCNICSGRLMPPLGSGSLSASSWPAPSSS